MKDKKLITVKEAAQILGVSEFTVRRMIQKNQLEAVMRSKKQGYSISMESLISYAKEHKSKISALLFSALPLTNVPMINNVLETTLLTYIYDKLGIDNDSLIKINNHLPDNKMFEEEHKKTLNNPLIIDKIINRLKAEIDDLDVQIEYQQLKIAGSETEEEKLSEEKNLLQIKQKKVKINKNIRDLELQRAIIKQTGH